MGIIILNEPMVFAGGTLITFTGIDFQLTPPAKAKWEQGFREAMIRRAAELEIERQSEVNDDQ